MRKIRCRYSVRSLGLPGWPLEIGAFQENLNPQGEVEMERKVKELTDMHYESGSRGTAIDQDKYYPEGRFIRLGSDDIWIIVDLKDSQAIAKEFSEFRPERYELPSYDAYKF